MARNYYQIAVQHPGLNKHRIIRGIDRYLVEEAAIIQERAWAEQYTRKVKADARRRSREDKRRELEDNVREAEERSAEAQAALDELRGVLAATLSVEHRVDWASRIQPPFSEPRPTQRPYLDFPKEPTFDPDDWKHRKSFITAVIPFLAKRAETAARAEFDAAHAKWHERIGVVDLANTKIEAENLRDNQEWKARRDAYEKSRTKHNSSVEQARADYQALNPDAILDYCDLVLSRSQYADCFPKEFELDYHAEVKTLIVAYQLPEPDDLPHLGSVKFLRTKGDFIETELTKRELEQLYSDVVFQIALRTVHELFGADVVRALDAVIFNGNVRTLNAGTGHQEERCILSVRAGRAAFESINLRNIEPRKCFESLGGIADAKMLDCRAVKPLGAIDKSEQRFAGAQDVSGEKMGATFDEPHALAVGHRSFCRDNAKPPTRYSHDGVSLAEMVEPAVATLEGLPATLEIPEDQAKDVAFQMQNHCTVPVEYVVQARTNLGEQLLHNQGTLPPGEAKKFSISVRGRYKLTFAREVDPSGTLRAVSFRLRHNTLAGEIRELPGGQITVPVQVKPKPTKLDTDALSCFDNI